MNLYEKNYIKKVCVVCGKDFFNKKGIGVGRPAGVISNKRTCGPRCSKEMYNNQKKYKEKKT